jgi:hypothetical protein
MFVIHSPGLGKVKQTVNTPIAIDILVNKTNIKIAMLVGFILKQKQNLFLFKTKSN